MKDNTSNLAHNQPCAEHHDQQEVRTDSCPGMHLYTPEKFQTGQHSLAKSPMTVTQIVIHALTLVQRLILRDLLFVGHGNHLFGDPLHLLHSTSLKERKNSSRRVLKGLKL